MSLNAKVSLFSSIFNPLLWSLFAEAALQWCSHERVFWKYTADIQENTHAEVWLAKQLYWNHTLLCVLSCKFAAYFQNTIS